MTEQLGERLIMISNKSQIYSFIILISIVSLLNMSALSGQKLSRYVIGSGGKAIKGEKIHFDGTLGQTFIGRIGSKKVKHGVGFWYNAITISNNSKPATLVMIPELSAWIGDTIEIPLILKESKFWSIANISEFEATISYNSSVLQPIDLIPETNQGGTTDYKISLHGKAIDSAGVIARPKFLVRLGDIESTPLIIESFEWIESRNVKIFKQNGTLTILGICKEGDTTRFVHKTRPAGIQSIIPNPASDYIQINYSIREEAYTKMSLYNNLGREIMIISDKIMKPGSYSKLLELSDIASGLYFVTLITPTQTFSKKIIISR